MSRSACRSSRTRLQALSLLLLLQASIQLMGGSLQAAADETQTAPAQQAQVQKPPRPKARKAPPARRGLASVTRPGTSELSGMGNLLQILSTRPRGSAPIVRACGSQKPAEVSKMIDRLHEAWDEQVAQLRLRAEEDIHKWIRECESRCDCAIHSEAAATLGDTEQTRELNRKAEHQDPARALACARRGAPLCQSPWFKKLRQQGRKG